MSEDDKPRPFKTPDNSMGIRFRYPYTRPDNSMAEAIYFPRGIQPQPRDAKLTRYTRNYAKMDFTELANKMGHANNGIILAFDPGHTTGYAVFESMQLADHGQIDTDDMEKATKNIGELITLWDHADAVVVENYRVYKWRAKHHAGSELLTARIIGCIETLCYQRGQFNLIKQPAHIAKGFCTDPKLREWGFFTKGEKHANDAIRHGAYFLIFGPINRKEQTGVTVG